MTLEEILSGLSAVAREAKDALSHGAPAHLDLERAMRVCFAARDVLRRTPATRPQVTEIEKEPDGRWYVGFADGTRAQVTSDEADAVLDETAAELNRDAATITGDQDPAPLLEQMVPQPVRIVVGTTVVQETQSGIYIYPHPGHVERADIEDLHKALGQYLARKSFEKATPIGEMKEPHMLKVSLDKPPQFGGWTFVDREDGVLVARSPNGTDVPIMWPAPEGESQSFADAVHVHRPQRCTAWTKPGWLGWRADTQPEDGMRCILANGHTGAHALEMPQKPTYAEYVAAIDRAAEIAAGSEREPDSSAPGPTPTEAERMRRSLCEVLEWQRRGWRWRDVRRHEPPWAHDTVPDPVTNGQQGAALTTEASPAPKPSDVFDLMRVIAARVRKAGCEVRSIALRGAEIIATIETNGKCVRFYMDIAHAPMLDVYDPAPIRLIDRIVARARASCLKETPCPRP